MHALQQDYDYPLPSEPETPDASLRMLRETSDRLLADCQHAGFRRAGMTRPTHGANGAEGGLEALFRRGEALLAECAGSAASPI